MLPITMYFMSEYDFRYEYECIQVRQVVYHRPVRLNISTSWTSSGTSTSALSTVSYLWKLYLSLEYYITSYAPTKCISVLDLNLLGQ